MRNHESGDSEDDIVDYTDEQVLAVKRVENAKDHYSVLGLQKEFTPDDLKKAYRRLALNLHPDKNRAPGAAEAFKRVGKAFGVLNDAEKRQTYDKYGTDDTSGVPTGAGEANTDAAWAYFERCYGGNISPEEVFNIFFGGRARAKDAFEPSQSAKFYYRSPGDSTFWADVQRMAPLVVLLCFALLSSLVGDWYYRTTWSATTSSVYSTARRTQSTEYDIEYFVASSFESDYPTVADMLKLEREVEKQVMYGLQRGCTSEKASRDQRIAAAQRAYFPDPYHIYNLKNQQLKACDKLKKLRKNGVRTDPVVGKPKEDIESGTEQPSDNRYESSDPKEPGDDPKEVVDDVKEVVDDEAGHVSGSGSDAPRKQADGTHLPVVQPDSAELEEEEEAPF